MAEAVTAYIGLGSNLGDRQGYMNRAADALGGTAGIELVRVSRSMETAPLAGRDQPFYLNAAAQILTTLAAEELIARLIDIEDSLHRGRGEKWSCRTIDLDLLLFGSEVINTPGLIVPHPQMHLRWFVLAGLCELDAGLVHPVIGRPITELAARLAGESFVLNPALPQLICIAGVIGVGKTTLAKALARSLRCELILEAYDTNPFLPEVYAGRRELALDSQLYFLVSRVGQLSPAARGARRIAVADYVFDKEYIYASRLLEPRQRQLYDRICKPLAADIIRPVLVIYLRDKVDNCLERIRRRNRSYEQNISLDFLQALESDYEMLFEGWKSCPLIRLSMAEFDCTKAADVAALAGEIKSYVAVSE
jgi:2-amino-4-hydroxy-6-hydroxymethyldihydropteridine diphosphokinase